VLVACPTDRSEWISPSGANALRVAESFFTVILRFLGMGKGPLAELLIERFETMPPRVQIAARFVLDRPREVALLSMREQAHQAGVSHTTMMRLARWVDLKSYEDMRSLYAGALRGPSYQTVSDEGQNGGKTQSTVEIVAGSLAAQISRLAETVNVRQICSCRGDSFRCAWTL
jgi:hypothetical protein